MDDQVRPRQRAHSRRTQKAMRIRYQPYYSHKTTE